MKYRNEFDSIGKIKVPGDKYWGASTQRSNKYFDIGDFKKSKVYFKNVIKLTNRKDELNQRAKLNLKKIK